MKKTFKYRAYPNSQTYNRLGVILGLCRIVYNMCLEQRGFVYKRFGKSVSAFDQIKQLSELKEDFVEFKQIPSQSLQEVVERVDKAFSDFFRRTKSGKKPGYPRFKGIGRYNSIVLKQWGWKLKDSCLIVKNIGTFKLKLHRPIEGDIKTINIQKTKTGKIFVCFSCSNVPENILSKTNKVVGMDVGCESFLTDSDGNKVENPRWFKKVQNKLVLLQRKIAKQVKGSNRRKSTKLLISKLHEKISNQRRDFHHKIARKYINENDIIIHEKLKVWKTFRSLNRSINDVAWKQFFNFLHYKAEEAGRVLIEVNPKDTSKTCSQCYKRVPKLLQERIHDCPYCGLVLDRDYNSALNILRLGASHQDSLSEKLMICNYK